MEDKELDLDFTLEDMCYECRGYGDDYRLSEDGELVSNCDDCWIGEKFYED